MSSFSEHAVVAVKSTTSRYRSRKNI